MDEAAKDPALEALRHGWDDVYEFGVGSEGYWARRRDGLGATLTDREPGEVRRQVHEDYAMKPVRNHRPGLGSRAERLPGAAS
jgi:hypothetical protein